MIHEVREKWNIAAKCPCGRSNITVATTTDVSPRNGMNQSLVSAAVAAQDEKKPLVNGEWKYVLVH